MTKNEFAYLALSRLEIYEPYIEKFKEDGTATLFENYAGFYIHENTEPELLAKIRAIESKHRVTVYAVTHEYTSFGELYDLLVVENDDDDDAVLTLKDLSDGYAFAYVWNKTDDIFSEFGQIMVKSFGGGIKRVG